MDITEWIGFIISVFAILFLLIRTHKHDKRMSQNPEEYARRQRERDRELRKLLNIEDKEEEEDDLDEDFDEVEEKNDQRYENVLPVVPQTIINLKTTTNITPPRPGPIRRLDQIKYKISKSSQAAFIIQDAPSKGHKITKKVSSKEMIVMREIIGPPKSSLARIHDYWL